MLARDGMGPNGAGPATGGGLGGCIPRSEVIQGRAVIQGRGQGFGCGRNCGRGRGRGRMQG